MQRAINQFEASFYNRLERVGGFGGKADRIHYFHTGTGDPDWFSKNLARYRAFPRPTCRLRYRRSCRYATSASNDGLFPEEGSDVRVWLSHGRSSRLRHHCLRHRPLETAGTGSSADMPPRIQKQALSTGCRVWLSNDNEVPVCPGRSRGDGGTTDDPAGKFGVASLTASMLMEGAGSRSSLDLADAVDFLGADLNASATSDISTVRLPYPRSPVLLTRCR